MDNTSPQNLHLTEKDFSEGLTPGQWAHIAACSRCADLFAEYMEARPLLSAPMDFQESVMKRSRQADIVMISKTNQISKRLQLFYYSLKVGFAVVCALFLLAVTPVSAGHFPQRLSPRWQSGHLWTIPKPEVSLNRRMQDITADLNDIFKWR